MKKILVIKIGSSVLLTKRHKLDQFRISHLAEQIIILRKQGFGVVLVISGAVAYGSNFVDLTESHVRKRQAAAGIGQVHVMVELSTVFNKLGLQLAQLLVTKDMLKSYQKNVKHLMEFYIEHNVIPIINENDVLDLNSFGGNDLLAAEVAKLLNTEKVIILSTMKGSIHGIGGGATKQQVIKMLKEKNIVTNIVNGKRKDVLLDNV